jgi:hypothetical protein
MDQRGEEATGVTRHAQGLAPEAITDTKGGIEALQGAANERIELVARWLAKGLQGVFESILHQVCAHQDGPRIVKIKGKPMPIDPRLWSDEMAVEVSTGMATENRQTRLMNLNMIAQKQEAIIASYGPANPICGVPEYRTTVSMLTESMGFKSPERFFKEVPEDYQPPEPGPDPKAADMEAKQKLSEMQAQHKAQMQEREFDHKQRMAEANFQSQEQLAGLKIQSEERMAQIRIQAEQRIAMMELQFEQRLSVWEAKQNAENARLSAHAKMTSVKANGSSVRPGGEIG